ncbi:hypothetical protein CCMA1212_006750 [Trichoderma ghanense]|uniref:Uncharacterized protein n=1 Tax=Trichoderma ghanense TaxID=65468 RepID=A0ABY2GZB0_9HYPO
MAHRKLPPASGLSKCDNSCDYTTSTKEGFDVRASPLDPLKLLDHFDVVDCAESWAATGV